MKFHYHLVSAVRTLGAKGRRNGLKIFTLGLGLASGVVLSSRVCFEFTYDNFYTDVQRVFFLSEHAVQNGKYEDFQQTSGGTAPLLKYTFPQIEEAARYTWLEYEASLRMVETNRRITADQVYLADSCIFRILDRECFAGNITSALGIDGNAVVSSSVACRIAQNSRNPRAAADEVIGKKFELGSHKGIIMTIAGVYEDFPLNSTWRPAAVVALPTIGKFMYDGTGELLGNDRYKSFIKLYPGTDIASVNDNIETYTNAYFPIEEMREAGVSLSYVASPLKEWHDVDQNRKNETLVLALVAFALLFISILNYLLIVVSTTVTRSREMALRKCLGSDTKETLAMMSAESAVHTLLSALLGAAIIIVFREPVQNILGMEVLALFTGKPLVIAISVTVLVFLVNGLLPALMFDRIPVASAFRNYASGKKSWKMALLCVEFAAVAFLGVLVCVISLQYKKITTTDLGFEYGEIIKIAIPESSPSQKLTFMDELRKLPCVADAAFSFSDPFDTYSGNNVREPGEIKDLFNVADAYYVDSHFFNVLGLDIVEGSPFNEGLGPDEEVIVDRNFVGMMNTTAHWDNVVGKEILITEHYDEASLPRICGVMEDIKIGNFSKNDEYFSSRPLAIFYANPETHAKYYSYILAKFHHISEDTMNQLQDLIQRILPDQMTYCYPLKEKMKRSYQDTLNTRNSILVGSIITILIAIIGLVGYTVDEIKRRGKEIAVRRVHGAQFLQIRRMFLKDMIRIALPSVIFGITLASIASLRWERQFTIQIGLPWWVLAGALVISLALILAISDFYVNRLANSNPAESIKTE